ncbi:MAG TPA: hypothetical protein VFZ40_14640 [Pyrinomonadaceae bacterium]
MLVSNKNIKADRFIWIFVVASASFWLASAWIASVSFADIWAMVRLLPNVVTVDVIAFAVFAKWLWKWRMFQGWLVPFPNLNGIWTGVIKPADDDEQPREIPTVAVIKQSFLSLSCVMHTAEMTSHSYSANFLIDEESQVRKLVYVYTSKPKVAVLARSPIHDGTTMLSIHGLPPRRLTGEYWNSRRRVGEISLAFDRRRRRKDIPEDLLPQN